jgi:BCD family chlorophyll transporter-like MFS transporter
MRQAPLGWFGILRLGLVQTALGAIVVLTTSTMNRVMVVELALPAMLPGALVALHYALQILRPRFGYGSDVGGRRTPWIIGGMAVLALGGFGAAVATAWMATNPIAGILLATLAFVLIGAGVGACGTTLLVLLAQRVSPERRAAAASMVWIMMIAGFVITATLAGQFLDPFSTTRLVAVTGTVAGAAFLLTVIALANLEGQPDTPPLAATAEPETSFRTALAEVWAEPHARRFAIFVFVSMLAYSAQDLILEPFAGLVFGFTPGESTKLAGVQHGGVMLGMILVGIAGSSRLRGRLGSLKGWAIGGCLASAAALSGLVVAGYVGPVWPFKTTVFVLGIANGAFAVAAIGSMMALVAAGRERREGVRMGLWGAAQAIAFGLGGFLGTAAIDLTRFLFQSPLPAYATVFAAEALMFLVSAWLAARVGSADAAEPVPSRRAAPEGAPLAVAGG